MATMCLPIQTLDIAERKIERVNAGLTFSQAMNLVVKTCFSVVHLTGAFHEAVTGQAALINALLDPRIHGLTPLQLGEIASKLDHLVRANEAVLEGSAKFNIRPWKSYLDTLAQQAEQISGIAESFHMSADSVVKEQLIHLAVSAERELQEAPEGDWREFIASLQD